MNPKNQVGPASRRTSIRRDNVERENRTKRDFRVNGAQNLKEERGKQM